MGMQNCIIPLTIEPFNKSTDFLFINTSNPTHGKLIFFYNMNLQIIEWYLIHKIITTKSCLTVALEFPDCRIQPNRLTGIKLITCLIYSIKYLMGTSLV